MSDRTPEEVNRLLAEKLFGFREYTVPRDWKWWGTDEAGAKYAKVPDFFHSPDLCINEIVPAMERRERYPKYMAAICHERVGWQATFSKWERTLTGTHATFSGAFCYAALAAVEGEGKP